MSISLDQLVYGVRMVETSGAKDGYTKVNDIGATGAYQVMPDNIGPWTREALGHAMTQAQFLASPAAQDAVARYKLGQSYKKYGPEGAAAVWFSGKPDWHSSASDGGNTVAQYVKKVMGWATGSKAGASQASAASPMPSVGHGIYTSQQAGYQADTRTNAFGAPVNPYKLPGWIASQQTQTADASAGVAQAGFGSGGGIFGGDSVPWDGVSTVVLSTLFILGGLGLVVVGLTNTVSPAVNAAKGTVTSVATKGAM